MKTFSIVCLVLITMKLSAQIDDSTSLKQLPFDIDDSKRMDEKDLLNKTEGYFLTGLPEIENNPINGFGIGANFFVYNNGLKEDPFFAYTPYRTRYTGFFKYFQSGKWQGAFNIDIPYIFDSKWRIRIDGVFENDPNFQYFGFGSNTMNPLQFKNKRTGVEQTYSTFNQYFSNLSLIRQGNSSVGEDDLVTDRHYNELEYSERLYNILAERTFASGRGRIMFGYELLFVSISDYFGRLAEEAFDENGNELINVVNGRTRLTEDFLGVTPGNPWKRHNIGGYKGGREGILAFALMYDTRDFEPDPTNGIFLEYSHEHSRPWMFSEFSFDKNFLHVAYFKRLFPENIKRMVFAFHGGIGYIWGSNIPFYEAMDLSSLAEAGGIEVLGGAKSLRGFREYRFVGPLTSVVNLELRTRVAETSLFSQFFSLDVLPFFDLGRVWNTISEFSFKNYRHSSGIGCRLAWNQSTILRADFAVSSESKQFFFGFSHVF